MIKMSQQVWVCHRLSAGGMWKTRFNSDSNNYGKEFANHPTPDVEAHEEEVDGLPCSGKIGIGPYTAVIFSQDDEASIVKVIHETS